MATIAFIHGLNTYGDDDIHVGPLTFGSMHARLESRLQALGHTFIPMTGLGFGAPEEQAKLALRQIPPMGDLHILGQSTGGLVARVLAVHPELSGRVRSILTIGTPHAGTLAAEFGLTFDRSHPHLAKLFALTNYDTQRKAAIFACFTPKALMEFNQRYPLADRGYGVYSLICEIERSELSWPLKIFYAKLHPNPCASDGFIWSESQKWGEPLGPFQLDHFSQLGFFPHLLPAARRKAWAEFERLIATIDTLVSK